MRPSPHGFVPAAGFLESTLKRMPEFHREEMPQYTLNEYDCLMDSSNMTPRDWQNIADDIQTNYALYDGFIVLHGTDTMAYTASILSFMFENLSKPVIITGSQIPLAQLRSDGQENLLNALYIAANFPIHEVGLYFNNRLFRGNRSRKIDANGFNAFASPNYPVLLDVGIDIKVVAGQLAEQQNNLLTVTPVTEQAVGVIILYPGISPEVIKNTLQQPVKALILLSYGVGNAPQSSALMEQCQSALEQEILIVNCTQCYKGKVNMDGYATGNALQQAGLISGADMTPEAALAKLHYLLSQPLSFEQRKHKLVENLRGELTP